MKKKKEEKKLSPSHAHRKDSIESVPSVERPLSERANRLTLYGMSFVESLLYKIFLNHIEGVKQLSSEALIRFAHLRLKRDKYLCPIETDAILELKNPPKGLVDRSCFKKPLHPNGKEWVSHKK